MRGGRSLAHLQKWRFLFQRQVTTQTHHGWNTADTLLLDSQFMYPFGWRYKCHLLGTRMRKKKSERLEDCPAVKTPVHECISSQSPDNDQAV